MIKRIICGVVDPRRFFCLENEKSEGAAVFFCSKFVRVWFVLTSRWFCAVRAFGTRSKGDPEEMNSEE